MKDLVLDASSIINLVATDSPASLLECIDGEVIVPEKVDGEVWRNPRTEEEEEDLLKPILATSAVRKVSVQTSEECLKHFLNLVSAEGGDDLGDGESATIAIANKLGYGAVIDDEKARRITRDQIGEIELFYTVEIFERRYRFAGSEEEAERQEKLLYQSLKWGYMAVKPEEMQNWVKERLSDDALEDCPSMRHAIED